MSNKQRLDKWLWMARFYKSRAVAVDAIKGGHVHVNGARCKPSRDLQVGDNIEIHKGIDHWRIRVEQLASRRGPATEARQLYHEDDDSIRQRQLQREQQKQMSPAPGKRPDKRQRRKIIRFINKRDL